MNSFTLHICSSILGLLSLAKYLFFFPLLKCTLSILAYYPQKMKLFSYSPRLFVHPLSFEVW